MSNSSVKKLTFLYDESRRAEDDQALPNFGGQISCSNMNEVYLEFRNLEVNGDIIIDNSPTNLIFSGTTKITGQIIIKNSANISIALLDQVELAASVKYEYSEVVEYISRGVDMSELKLTNLESKVQTILLD